MKLSIVTTLYRSQATIDEFIRRMIAAAERVGDFEIVIVDDGSPDGSLAAAIRWAERDPRLKIIELSRNFGHHKALMTGLMHAVGDYGFLIDSDLEEAPELLADFWNRLQTEPSLDVVYGVQARRSGGAFRKLTGAVAYRLIDWLIPYKIPRNHLTVRLMRRPYIDALISHREHQVVIGGLWVITGFRQAAASVEKTDKGASSYSLLRRWTLLLDSVTSFSEAPLVAIFYVGVAISILAASVALYLALRWMFVGAGVPGWASVMVSVWMLGGLSILFIGIIGIYLSKIFIETKNRPYTIVRNVHQRASFGNDGKDAD